MIGKRERGNRMTRLIDADKAERDIEELRKSDWFNAPYLSKERKIGLSEAFDMIQSVCIKHAPTVDAEPVRHARLINAYPYGECSCCGELIDSRDRFRYCPQCGARLDGDKHGTD